MATKEAPATLEIKKRYTIINRGPLVSVQSSVKTKVNTKQIDTEPGDYIYCEI